MVTPEERKKYSLAAGTTHIYQANGCSSCHQTGYHGREAVAEIVLFEEGSLRKTAKHQSFSTLWNRGIEKVLAGKTTLAEIDRAIGIQA